jgi:hypothetical protein
VFGLTKEEIDQLRSKGLRQGQDTAHFSASPCLNYWMHTLSSIHKIALQNLADRQTFCGAAQYADFLSIISYLKVKSCTFGLCIAKETLLSVLRTHRWATD